MSSDDRERSSGLLLVAAAGLAAFVSPLAGAILASIGIVLVVLIGKHRDAVTLISGMFVLLVAVPTRYSFEGFGPLTPGMLLGSVAMLFWVIGRIGSSRKLDRGRQPIRPLMAMLLVLALVGFATTFTHVTTDEHFVSAHRSPLLLAMFAGVAVVVADGASSRRRLDDLIEVLVLCGGVLAVCGLIEQIQGHRLFVGSDVPPGLTENPSQLTIPARAGFLRVGGTAKHPIEFAVVLAATLPLALHLAIHGRAAIRRTAALLALVIAAAIPFAVSRSGVIGAIVGCLVLAGGWTWRRRATVVTGAVAVVVSATIIAPGLMGAIGSLFTTVGDDASIAARTRDYAVLDEVWTTSPIFGFGVGEYNIVDYEVFDNQYLASFLEGGVLGVIGTLATFIVPIALVAPISRKRARTDSATSHLARALMASLTCLGVTWAFFDGAGYRIATALLFTLAGAAGALWRFERRDRVRREPQRPTPISVIVPAHDEAAVIERCMQRILDGARPGEIDLVVVCNGCTDDTAAIARSVASRATVLELAEGSKHAALNAGDTVAVGFPRFYVDADVELDIEAIRATAAVLRDGTALCAAPRIELDLEGCAPPVRAFYRTWLQMPYVTDELVGSGVYAVNEAGHQRLGGGRFPDIIADDLWVRNRFTAAERRSVASASFVQRPPRDLQSLIRVRTRHMLGNLEYRDRFPDEAAAAAAESEARDARWWLARRSRSSTAVYLTINALARRMARQHLQRDDRTWKRDVTARLGGTS